MEPSGRSRRSGLEIAQIGALYEGQWEKKYWSSSRVCDLPLSLCPTVLDCSVNE